MDDKLLEYLIATGQMEKSFGNKNVSEDFDEYYDIDENDISDEELYDEDILEDDFNIDSSNNMD